MLRSSNTEPQRFALEQVRRLLKDLTIQVSRANHTCTADSVHDLRIAVRRLVRTITVCKAFFHGKAIRKCRRRLTKIMTAAGAVRDCDVALRYAAKWPTPDTPRFESKLERRRNESARILIAELNRWKGRAALEVSLVQNHNSPPGTVRELAQRALHRLAKRFEDRGNEASASLASAGDLHRFRIAAKKYRYTLELFHHLDSSLSGKVEKLKPATALLGDINDCVTAAAILDDYQKTDRLIDRLEKRRRKKTKAFRKYWEKNLAGLEAPTIA